MSFDTEDILKNIKTVLIANLNTEITRLNTKKGDTLLNSIQDSAYYLQNLDDEAFSYQNFVVFGLMENPTFSDSLRSDNIHTLNVFVEVCIARDYGVRKENAFYKLLRYTRALENIVYKKSDKIQAGIKWKVTSLTPTSFNVKSEGEEIVKEFMTGGISMTAAISSPL